MDFNNIQSLNADRLTSLSKSLTYDYSDTLIWTKGSHTFKFGGDIQALEAITPLGFNGSDNYGTYTFNTSGSTGLFTGVDFADFLLGIPDQTFYDVVKQDNDGSPTTTTSSLRTSGVQPRLTLSYGLRYELHPGYYDKYGDIGNFDPSVALAGRVIYPQGKQDLLAQCFLASANACDPDGVNNTNTSTVNGAPCMQVEGNCTASYPAGLKKYPHLRFMPRFGFAYRPFDNDKWAIRGGFGIYNINMLGSSFYSLTGTVQAQTQQFVNTYNPATHAIGYQWPQSMREPGTLAGIAAMAPTTSAPRTAQTGRTLTRCSGRQAWSTTSVRAMPGMLPILARWAVTKYGLRTRTLCPSPPRSPLTTRPSHLGSIQTGDGLTTA